MKTLSLACLSLAVLAVSACSGYTTYEQTPYRGRTAGAGVVAAQADGQPVSETRSAEPIFRSQQAK